EVERLLALVGRRELEDVRADGRPRAEELGLEGRELAVLADRGAERLAEVLMDRAIVVDDQDAGVRFDVTTKRRRGRHRSPPQAIPDLGAARSGDGSGSRRTKRAPCPRPS